MNTETGQIKDEKDLTEEEKKSGKWVKFFERDGKKVFVHERKKTKSELKREEYAKRVAEKRASGENF